VLTAGADSVAVVTDIVTAEDPEAKTRDWLAATRGG
jgi:thiamine-phosphate pyrophosphorylase